MVRIRNSKRAQNGEGEGRERNLGNEGKGMFSLLPLSKASSLRFDGVG